MKEHDVDFKLNNKRLSCFYKNKILDFSGTRDILNFDRCINGFLFGGKIYRNSDISLLKDSPELISDIEKVINNNYAAVDLVNNYKERSNPYIFKIKVPINELIFDSCGLENECNIKYNTDQIFDYIGSYLINSKLHRGFSNPIVRLRDDAIVNKDDILAIFKINVDELIY